MEKLVEWLMLIVQMGESPGLYKENLWFVPENAVKLEDHIKKTISERE